MVDFDERKPWDRSRDVVLIGPGGSGKSSLGLALAPLLKRFLVDLDDEFSRQIGNIGQFIRKKGYEAYKIRNSDLAGTIMSNRGRPKLVVTSSGFLTSDNPAKALEANRSLTKTCYSICLLPSRDIEQSVRIIVERQLQRPFTRDQLHEESTIRARFPEYVQEGDLRVFSLASPSGMADAIAHRLSIRH